MFFVKEDGGRDDGGHDDSEEEGDDSALTCSQTAFIELTVNRSSDCYATGHVNAPQQ